MFRATRLPTPSRFDMQRCRTRRRVPERNRWTPGGRLDPRLTAACDDEQEPPSRPLLRGKSSCFATLYTGPHALVLRDSHRPPSR
jgi:hypothetical protein